MNTSITTDNPVGHDIEAEANEVLDILSKGGLAIIPLNVAYAIVGQTESAIRKIFEVKKRSYEKPSGMFGGVAASADVHMLSDQGEAIREALVNEANLPFSIVAEYHKDSPLIADVESFVLKTSTKGDTMDMLLNAGPFHNAMAAITHARKTPVFGSSANQSLSGSKYLIEEIEKDVLDAVDIVIDHGRCRDANDQGLSSTIIDFRDFSVVRVGCRFDELQGFIAERFGVTLNVGK